jgi:hypothetical protein
LGVVGLSAAEQAARKRAAGAAPERRSCIFLFLTGGPSHLETFDPKPEAPLGIRGPFRPIATNVPGMSLSENLPLLAQRAHQFSLLRSLSHDAAPIHETGQQLLQTGRLAQGGVASPSFGSVVAKLAKPMGEIPPYVVLPRVMQNTGVYACQSQRAGFLGPAFDPRSWDPTPSSHAADSPIGGEGETSPAAFQLQPESGTSRSRYGATPFGQACLLARRLVEQGTRFVSVNMFDGLTNPVTWDCHAHGRWTSSNLYDYRDTLCPDFDRACAALLDDLAERGLLEQTLVVATGEFGRTPRINDFGGRDHWTNVWSALVAGGGTHGGRIIGASDPRGAYPADRPISPAELAATIFESLGIDPKQELALPEGRTSPLADGDPIAELFA